MIKKAAMPPGVGMAPPWRSMEMKVRAKDTVRMARNR